MTRDGAEPGDGDSSDNSDSRDSRDSRDDGDFEFLPQWIEFTPEEEALLDELWAERQAYWGMTHPEQLAWQEARARECGDIEMLEAIAQGDELAKRLTPERIAELAREAEELERWEIANGLRPD